MYRQLDYQGLWTTSYVPALEMAIPQTFSNSAIDCHYRCTASGYFYQTIWLVSYGEISSTVIETKYTTTVVNVG